MEVYEFQNRLFPCQSLSISTDMYANSISTVCKYIGNTCSILTYIVITICVSLLYIGAAVIQGPDVVIYRPNEELVELTCVITEGSTGWRVNDSSTFSLSEIRNGRLPDHTVNGVNLVIVNATNNTEYICVSIRDAGNLESSPVRLYIAGMYICCRIRL